MSRRNGSRLDSATAHSRREFLGRAGTIAGGLMFADLAGLFRGKVSAAENIQSYAGGMYMLELDGAPVGWIRSFEGGAVRGEVVVEPPGASPFAKKHLGMARFEPITLSFDAGMGKPFYDWVKASLSGQPVRKSGAIVMTDFKFIPKRRIEFQNALITEIASPLLDGGLKVPASFTVRLAPEFARAVTVGGAAAPLKWEGSSKTSQKILLQSNFRLKIQGLEQACARVSHIEAIKVRRKTTVDSVGEMRNQQAAPGVFEFQNLVFTLPEVYAGPFQGWHEDFVVKGNNKDALERSGMVEILSPNLSTVLFTLSFFNLGIISAAPATFGTADTQLRTKVELYCERIGFDAGPVGGDGTKGSAAPPPPVRGIAPAPGTLAPRR